jgi:hypothetical protein
MRKHRLAKVAAIVFVIALAIWAYFAFFAPKTIPQAASFDDRRPAPQTIPHVASSHDDRRASQQTATPTTTSSATQAGTPDLSVYKTDPKWIWWNEKKARDPQFEWKMPISFYGKVVDENSQPVPGATASFVWTDMSAQGTSTAESVSDRQGLFLLDGLQGKRLQVRVKKDGYYTNPQNPFTFEYAAFFEPNYHKPDRDNPVIFRLRKKGDVPKELIVRESLIGITPNGSPHSIDLRTARKASPGDIVISITRAAPKDVRKYDWSLTIEGVNGAGLIESNEQFMFEAPEEGYLTQYNYQFDVNSPNWQNQLRRNYFVRSGDGRVYARIEIKAMPKYQDSAAARVLFFVNPTGSRNLEYQPNKILPSN